MTLQDQIDMPRPTLETGQIFKLAVMAVGGQGGGVLASWIEKLARAKGFAVQATSVAGVAQRTGATIYYLEMAPSAERIPVFSLAPTTGDVDIVIAAEMMEAGRAILRGFVTPDRTVLIASAHRALAVSEKVEPGNGVANPEEVRAAAEIAAQRLILFDMEQIAQEAGSVISASLFGALAGAEVLPFQRRDFEAAILSGGRGAEASLRAFSMSYAKAKDGFGHPEPVSVQVPRQNPEVPSRFKHEWAGLSTRLQSLPAPVAGMARRGLQKVVDFQDLEYGAEYLARVEGVLAQDSFEKGFILSSEAAKYIANAMAYDDVIRVADLKTRASRFSRIRSEMRMDQETVLRLTEFMHPRAEEIAGLLPARFGAKVAASPKTMLWLDRLFN